MRRLTALALLRGPLLLGPLLLGLGACSTTVPTGSDAGNGRGYVVFFQEWSAGLDHAANNVIAAAARAAAAAPDTPVHVVGSADTLGSPQANVYLSETRAQVVADALVTDGVAANRIVQQARGSLQPVGGLVESRRVTITIGG
jgi:outer membrane protein OmpA-like peptidoglycan-associated protein